MSNNVEVIKPRQKANKTNFLECIILDGKARFFKRYVYKIYRSKNEIYNKRHLSLLEQLEDDTLVIAIARLESLRATEIGMLRHLIAIVITIITALYLSLNPIINNDIALAVSLILFATSGIYYLVKQNRKKKEAMSFLKNLLEQIQVNRYN
ncbi:hypothetical protein WAK64_05140 [Bacillus spongiae]|uniref:Uncharacterized protein n=1 Tax=Bacillus spongiae TaxID=2683610 RepID=A0ABU8HAU7_9BACI